MPCPARLKLTEYFSNELGDFEDIELDFENITMEHDTRKFLSPSIIKNSYSIFFYPIKERIASIINKVVQHIRNERKDLAVEILQLNKELNDTHLGYSSCYAQGNGIGEDVARFLVDAIEQGGFLNEDFPNNLDNLKLFVPFLSHDRISDLVTNLSRDILIEYTQKQCELFNIPLVIDNRDVYYWESSVEIENWMHANNFPRLIVRDRNFSQPNSLYKYLFVPSNLLIQKDRLFNYEFSNYIINKIQIEKEQEFYALTSIVVEARDLKTKQKIYEKLKENDFDIRDKLKLKDLVRRNNAFRDRLNMFYNQYEFERINISRAKYNEYLITKENKLNEINVFSDELKYRNYVLGFLAVIFNNMLYYPTLINDVNDFKNKPFEFHVNQRNEDLTAFFPNDKVMVYHKNTNRLTDINFTEIISTARANNYEEVLLFLREARSSDISLEIKSIFENTGIMIYYFTDIDILSMLSNSRDFSNFDYRTLDSIRTTILNS
ncbi:MAG: hypothetical protein JXR64_13700 [Spirochaetales bacterium]|nr:hypothetical protein [Spirochaetales bacterium]